MKETERFERSIQFVLKWEGGYSNDVTDPGGETKYGISKRSHPKVDIKNLTKEQAIKIYYEEYWAPSGAILASWPLCVVMLDTAVNLGIRRMQRLYKDVEAKNKALGLIEKRRLYYQYIATHRPKFKKYLKGWLNRINDLRKYIGD